MLHTKFKINWPFGSGEEGKIDFQEGGHGGHLGFPIGTILALFDLQVIPMLTSFGSTDLSVQEKQEKKKKKKKKKKKDFKDVGHGSYLGFLIGKISAFYLQVTPMLYTKFHVIGLQR